MPSKVPYTAVPQQTAGYQNGELPVASLSVTGGDEDKAPGEEEKDGAGSPLKGVGDFLLDVLGLPAHVLQALLGIKTGGSGSGGDKGAGGGLDINVNRNAGSGFGFSDDDGNYHTNMSFGRNGITIGAPQTYRHARMKTPQGEYYTSLVPVGSKPNTDNGDVEVPITEGGGVDPRGRTDEQTARDWVAANAKNDPGMAARLAASDAAERRYSKPK